MSKRESIKWIGVGVRVAVLIFSGSILICRFMWRSRQSLVIHISSNRNSKQQQQTATSSRQYTKDIISICKYYSHYIVVQEVQFKFTMSAHSQASSSSSSRPRREIQGPLSVDTGCTELISKVMFSLTEVETRHSNYRTWYEGPFATSYASIMHEIEKTVGSSIDGQREWIKMQV